jgi:putative tricarboxylic transport membrane protein
MQSFVKNPKDFFCGLLLLAIAAIFTVGIFELPIGTAFRMGPGYFPLVLVILLATFGVIILINGLRTEGEPIGAIPWRGVALISLPVVFYGVTLKGLGIVPALAITVFMTTLASQRWSPIMALTLTATLVVFSVAVFIYGLGLPLSLFGPWVGGY